ncbi:hypothetical protein C7H83_11265 [Tetragenococcus halophilus]|uniref:Uncharacterized protein n=1 Tax=Tetragenococcus halophilus TaxID=51669 RepID=A0A3G5FLI4_TETHA|nr:hypothetical protein [Tetragenococcus halophilus]AYW51008.1 hypothetical protein C7H83_11265 [Tetragenococcus halophilus]GBD64309.1 hypothetical protein TEHD23766T_1736 [Tetragenococcus halophilus subsp. flandriensis]
MIDTLETLEDLALCEETELLCGDNISTDTEKEQPDQEVNFITFNSPCSFSCPSALISPCA